MTVTLDKEKTKINGSTYEYWRIRWLDTAGRRQSKQIRRANGPKALSKRQAKVLVSRLEAELTQKPGLHSRKVPTLVDYTTQYLEGRSSVKAGTAELERQTIKYLLAWFGNIRVDRIDKAAARAFRTALAKGDPRIEMTLTIKRTLFEDANLEGNVNAEDLTNVRTTFGSTGGWADGNFNDDDIVDANDLVEVRQNFGMLGESPPLPESNSMLIFSVAITLFGMKRRPVSASGAASNSHIAPDHESR